MLREAEVNLVDTVMALLFVSEAPASAQALAATLQISEGQTVQALEVLEARLDESGPLTLIKLAGGYQLCTKPQYAELVAAYLKPQTNKLSRSMMEVLAIVAYNQPMTAADIERIRGVQSDYGIRSLVERRLIHEVGRKATPGRPVLYGTTDEFLHQFKLQSIENLPPLQQETIAKWDELGVR